MNAGNLLDRPPLANSRFSGSLNCALRANRKAYMTGDPDEETEMSWEESEKSFAEYEKEQLRNFFARIGPAKARLLGSTQVTGYRTPSSSLRWATRQRRRN